MVSIVVSIHVIVCVAICIIILLQQGKGAEVGAVFGGSSQTVFGASGAGNALTKATWGLAIIFFASSIFLALASARRVTGSIFDRPFSSAPSSVMPASKAAAKNANPAGAALSGHTPAPAGATTPSSAK
jgi:preprotein translocase subunit SecG